MKYKSRGVRRTRKYKKNQIVKSCEVLIRKKPLQYWLVTIFTATCLILTFLYHSFKTGLYVVDDPSLINIFTDKNTSLLEKIFAPIANRWRPFTNFAYWILVYVIKSSYAYWLAASFLIFASVTTYMSYKFLKINHSFYVSTIIMLLLVTSRFNQGILLNATFLLETIAAVFLLQIVIVFRKNWGNSSFAQFIPTIGLYSLLIITHERYVGLNLFFVVYFLLQNYFTTENRIRYLLGFTLPTLILFAIKSFILEIPIFVGTGSATEVGFKVSTAVYFLYMLITGLLGINIGFQYLQGYIFEGQEIFHKSVSLSIAIISIFLLVSRMRNTRDKMSGLKRQIAKKFTVLISLFISIALPVISTIRLEPRWYFPIYILFLFYLLSNDVVSIQPKQKNSRKFSSNLLIVFVILNIFMNYQYSQKMNDLYFVQSQAILKSQISSIEESLPKTKNIDRNVYILDPENSINLKSLQLAITVNTPENRVKLIQISELNQIPGTLRDANVFELDPTILNGGFRRVDLK